MALNRFNKLFSLDEANELIPRLEILVRELQLQAQELCRRANELARSDQTLEAPELTDLLEFYPELKPIAVRLGDIASEIESMGCLLKDIDQGLIDFPSVIEDANEEEDNVAFLCWQFGEPSVIAWHPLDGGFAQRRPLRGAPRRLLN